MVGEIVNFISVDTQQFIELANEFHYIWSGPLQIVISIVLLYIVMGPSAFAGVGVMILMIPINVIIAAITRKLQVNLLGFMAKATTIYSGQTDGTEGSSYSADK